MSYISENIFVINLQHDIEKNYYMQKLCDSYNLSPEFITAVDGRLLSDKEIDAVYSKDNSIKEFGRELSKAEIGCALSHKKIYQKIVDENINEALILEDDVEFNDDLLEVLDKLTDFPDNWNLVLLGHHACKDRDLRTSYSLFGRKKITHKHILTRPTECGCGTYGYLLKFEAAKIMLNDLEVIYKPIDHYTGVDKYLNLYTVSPAPIYIHHFLSDNCNSMNERKKLQNNYKLTKHISLKRKILDFFYLSRIVDNIRAKLKIIRCFFKVPRTYS